MNEFTICVKSTMLASMVMLGGSLDSEHIPRDSLGWSSLSHIGNKYISYNFSP